MIFVDEINWGGTQETRVSMNPSSETKEDKRRATQPKSNTTEKETNTQSGFSSKNKRKTSNMAWSVKLAGILSFASNFWLLECWLRGMQTTPTMDPIP